MKLIISCILFLLPVVKSVAQTKGSDSTIAAITIGQSLPDIPLKNIFNSKQSASTTNGYRGKLLILDFWATWCTPCVAAMPKLDSLQQQFKDQVQILPVTYQPKEDVERIFKKSTKLQKVSLPIITGDNTLRFLFPHKELPHYVWIGKDGKVIAITSSEYVNRDTIQKVLQSSDVSLKVKKDVIKKYDRNTPLLFQPLGFAAEDLEFQSILTRFKAGLSSRLDVLRYDNKKISKISMTNSTLKSMYSLAWSNDTRFFINSKVFIESADSLKIITNASGEKAKEWVMENTWCYELILPEWANLDANEIMRADLARYFPQYTAVVEKRMKRSLVLERTSTIDKLQTKGGEPKHSFGPYGGAMINCKIGLLTAELNHFLQNLEIPVIDATGYKGSVDLVIDANISNMDSLRKALQEYDLDFIEKDYPIEVLVIKDFKPGDKRQ